MQERIIVVDDCVTSCAILDHMLSQAGYLVVCTSNGAEALAEIKKGPYQFVITDIAMPVMDGYALIREMAEMHGNRAAVIVVSERGAPIIETALELARVHGLDFLGALAKPVSRAELLLLLGQTVAPHLEQSTPIKDLLAEEVFSFDLLENSLTPVFQPSINCSDGSIYGVECLSRWKTTFGGLVGPDIFLPIAARHGFSPFVTRRMLSLALTALNGWRKEEINVNLNVNVSPNDICSMDFVDVVAETLEEHGVQPELLTLELTETDIIDDLATALEVLGRLRLMGVGLSLDDFGAGIDPLLRLKTIPFTELKTVKPFVRDAAGENKSSVILDNTIKLAQRLGLAVTCEGVENSKQMDLARELGADRAQGYFIARPMSGVDFVHWAKKWQPHRFINTGVG